MDRKYTRLIFTLLALLLLALPTLSRIYTNEVNILAFKKTAGWMFLDRMTFGEGQLYINFEVILESREIKPKTAFYVEIALVKDDGWEAEAVRKCDRQKLTQPQMLKVKGYEMNLYAPLTDLNDYYFYSQSRRKVPSSQMYHFVLRDCGQALMKENFPRDAKLKIKMDLKNNGLNYSETESAYGWLLPSLVVLTFLMLFFIRRDKEEDGENWVKYLLKISLWVSFCAILFKYVWYFIYANINGVDYQIFDFLYLLFHSIADSTVVVLLLLLSYGWTVTFNSSRDFDLYVPLACMLGLINVIMTLLNKITDGQHDKYHMYDTVPAYILVFFKLLGLVIFTIGIVKSFLDLRRLLAIEGGLYLSFLPLSLYFITFIQTKYRKEVMFIVLEVVRNGINLALIYMSASKKSSYRAILGRSLPEKDNKLI